jgi:transposase-like protein
MKEVILIEWLLKALRDSGLFRRNGFLLHVKIRAILLYMADMSHREITYVLRVVPSYHEAIRLWVKRLEQLITNIEARPRSMVAVDKTKVDGEWYYVWAAVDVDTRELLVI